MRNRFFNASGAYARVNQMETNFNIFRIRVDCVRRLQMKTLPFQWLTMIVLLAPQHVIIRQVFSFVCTEFNGNRSTTPASESI